MKLSSIDLSAAQRAIASSELRTTTFLEGPAGAGKTTAGVARMLELLRQGVMASSLLVLVPVRPLGAPYADALRRNRLRPGSIPSVATVGGLARRSVELFWPLVSRQAGFVNPDRSPTFLTLETAQYQMARIVRPLLDDGFFESVTIDRNRLYSQIIDNLNKAAVVGFPAAEIGQRLQSAALAEEVQARVYSDAQTCASLFREHCLRHNLLDFSLQVELFRRYLWPLPECREHLVTAYRHLIVDNVEEDTPFAHTLVRDWLPLLDSALLIYDQDAGYRQFLGADPVGASELRALCAQVVVFDEQVVSPPPLQAVGALLADALQQPTAPMLPDVEPEAVRAALQFKEDSRFYPQMLDWVAGEIAALVEQGTTPGEIVVLAPFLSDSLRFSLTHRLEGRGIAVRSHRPSRALRDEPAARTLLTMAALANPGWDRTPLPLDVADALLQAIDSMDLVRARLLTQIVYRTREGAPAFSSFEQINPEMHQRISYVLGGRFDTLRVWLADVQRRDPVSLDHFISRLFGEVLSQGGFGFHGNFDASQVAANLVESMRKFREAMAAGPFDQAESGDDAPPAPDMGREYRDMVEDGVIAAQYVRGWQETDRNAVLLAPAHTFLMMNQPVDYQFWLDVGSRGWYERLYQPLTHPYVLSQHWQPGRQWDHDDEERANQQRLYRVSIGLLRRCRKQVFLGLSELGEQGYEQRGPLLWSFNHVLRKLAVDDLTTGDRGQ